MISGEPRYIVRSDQEARRQLSERTVSNHGRLVARLTQREPELWREINIWRDAMARLAIAVSAVQFLEEVWHLDIVLPSFPRNFFPSREKLRRR